MHVENEVAWKENMGRNYSRYPNWLVVWIIFYFPYIRNNIIPTDELHDFSEG